MDVFEAVLLGLIQGITEWLPISSSAHLAIAQNYLGIEASVAFDIILHLGTLVAVVAYYRKDILSLCRGLLRWDAESVRISAFILLCAVPTAIIGLLMKDFFEGMFSSMVAIATALCMTGVFLLLSSRASDGKGALDAGSALIVGIAQGLAVAPGISRSGSTIGTALLIGIEREQAARFSFLAAVLPILGAAVLEGRHALEGQIELGAVLAGFAAAAISGYLAIGLLLRLLRERKFQWFGFYCLALAALLAAASIAS